MFLYLNSWAGRTCYRCRIVRETLQRYVIELLDDCPLKGKQAGERLIVPKYAVRAED
jgi:hypothetical protein